MYLVQHRIPTDQLAPEDVPDPWAPQGEISKFALTFDGYGHDALMREGADDPKVWAQRWEQMDPLDRMRSELFFEQRAGHWKNDGKTDEEREVCMRGMVASIRSLVLERYVKQHAAGIRRAWEFLESRKTK